jgi:RNA polymerase sigma factor (sigma-70 family)
MLSFETIKAAQSNDLAAVTEVIEATESRVKMLADKAARRMAPHGGALLANYREEFAQVGRIAVWELLDRFTDTTAEGFMRLAYTTVERTLLDAVRAERNGGVDENAMKTFAAMIEAADGDMYEAAKLAQVLPPKGRRLSAERAEAARLAFQGNLSIDRATGVNDGGQSGTATIADTLSVTDEEPDGELRPKVGHGAALEALSVLERYTGAVVGRMTPGEFAANLPALVESLEDVVRVPSDPTTRRYVLDAMAVLRSAVSTATEGALVDELKDVSDDRRAESAEKHDRVNTCLDSMGGAQRDVLRHSFGIGDATDFGWGDGCDMDGLCEALGMTYVNAKAHRAKGRKAFAKRYVAAVGIDKPALAAVLEAAAASTLTYAGRK